MYVSIFLLLNYYLYGMCIVFDSLLLYWKYEDDDRKDFEIIHD